MFRFGGGAARRSRFRDIELFCQMIFVAHDVTVKAWTSTSSPVIAGVFVGARAGAGAAEERVLRRIHYESDVTGPYDQVTRLSMADPAKVWNAAEDLERCCVWIRKPGR